MPSRQTGLITCHLAAFVLAVAMCIWRFDAGATMLLYASSFFLILDKVDTIREMDAEAAFLTDGQLNGQTVSDLVRAVSRFERRQAMLAEVLSVEGAFDNAGRQPGIIAALQRLAAEDDDADDIILALRDDILAGRAARKSERAVPRIS